MDAPEIVLRLQISWKAPRLDSEMMATSTRNETNSDGRNVAECEAGRQKHRIVGAMFDLEPVVNILVKISTVMSPMISLGNLYSFNLPRAMFLLVDRFGTVYHPNISPKPFLNFVKV